jgi:hypothetical protein
MTRFCRNDNGLLSQSGELWGFTPAAFVETEMASLKSCSSNLPEYFRASQSEQHDTV